MVFRAISEDELAPQETWAISGPLDIDIDSKWNVPSEIDGKLKNVSKLTVKEMLHHWLPTAEDGDIGNFRLYLTQYCHDNADEVIPVIWPPHRAHPL